jgi:predicted DNA-binding transcriptional regulator YafY
MPAYFDEVQRAVIEGEQLRLGYVARDREPSSRIVHPLGLAAKGAAWYLVADTDAGLRTFRVDRITTVEATGEAVVRPPGFDLADAWKLATDEVDQRRTPTRARAKVTPEAVGYCRYAFGNRVHIGPADDAGQVEIEVRGHSPRMLAGELARFGSMLEVIEPPEVRAALAQLAGELAAIYGPG